MPGGRNSGAVYNLYKVRYGTAGWEEGRRDGVNDLNALLELSKYL